MHLTRRSISKNVCVIQVPPSWAEKWSQQKWEKLQFLKWPLEACSKIMPIPIIPILKTLQQKKTCLQVGTKRILVSIANYPVRITLYYNYILFKLYLVLKLWIIKGHLECQLAMSSLLDFTSANSSHWAWPLCRVCGVGDFCILFHTNIGQLF